MEQITDSKSRNQKPETIKPHLESQSRSLPYSPTVLWCQRRHFPSRQNQISADIQPVVEERIRKSGRMIKGRSSRKEIPWDEARAHEWSVRNIFPVRQVFGQQVVSACAILHLIDLDHEGWLYCSWLFCLWNLQLDGTTCCINRSMSSAWKVRTILSTTWIPTSPSPEMPPRFLQLGERSRVQVTRWRWTKEWSRTLVRYRLTVSFQSTLPISAATITRDEAQR